MPGHGHFNVVYFLDMSFFIKNWLICTFIWTLNFHASTVWMKIKIYKLPNSSTKKAYLMNTGTSRIISLIRNLAFSLIRSSFNKIHPTKIIQYKTSLLKLHNFLCPSDTHTRMKKIWLNVKESRKVRLKTTFTFFCKSLLKFVSVTVCNYFLFCMPLH